MEINNLMEGEKKSGKRVIIMFIVAIALIVFFLYTTRTISRITGKSVKDIETEEEILAKCLTEKGAKMYGAYWCGACNSQKGLFEEAFQYIDYVECDPQGENANPKECSKMKITSYPTWIIKDKYYTGVQPLTKLKSLTGC